MKHHSFILLLIILTACVVPEFKPPTEEEVIEPEPIEQLEEIEQLQATQPVKTVTATDGQFYGYDKNNNLVYYETPEQTWTLYYEGGKLEKIEGKETTTLEYQDGRLARIDGQPFFYDEKGRLITVQDDESLHLEYDSKDDIRIARRGIAGKTSLDYKDNRTKYITRGSVRTTVYYDDKNRTRLFDQQDSHITLGYWRDDKLIKLSGSTIGEGIEVSYGPDTQPTQAQIISQTDKTRFTAPSTDALYKTVDLYLYCNYLRRLPVIFDGISYTMVREYFDENIQDYFIKNQICKIYQ